MYFHPTNSGVLYIWRFAFEQAGPAMLAPFGLTTKEIATVATASNTELYRWSLQATPLVQPRPGLLRALHDNREAEIDGHIADTRTAASGPDIYSQAHSFNRLILDTWSNAVRSGENMARFELSEDEAKIMSRASPQRLSEWSGLPIAIAVPRPGLIAALHCGIPAALFSFIKPCEENIRHDPPGARRSRAKSPSLSRRQPIRSQTR
ncbi:MAG: hypothetical protein AB7I59_01855 [Geminicoccaceae bacterium]